MLEEKKRTFYLKDLELVKRLEEYAEKTERPMSWIVLKALEQYLNEKEKDGNQCV